MIAVFIVASRRLLLLLRPLGFQRVPQQRVSIRLVAGEVALSFAAAKAILQNLPDRSNYHSIRRRSLARALPLLPGTAQRYRLGVAFSSVSRTGTNRVI